MMNSVFERDIFKVDLSLSEEDFYLSYGRKKTVTAFTLGCKVNQYETEAMLELFEKRGYKVLSDDACADVYIINTCTVTKLSDKKSRQFIRRARRLNERAIVAVVGCYAQVAVNEVKKIAGINAVLGTDKRSKIVDVVEDVGHDEMVILVEDIMRTNHFEELEIDSVKGKTRAFLKIQEGCNQYCTYCIIPYARGRVRSRQPENIYREVRRLSENGFREIVLTGIHVASYGKDLSGVFLEDVLQGIHDIEGIVRIRLSSLEPRLFTDRFIDTIKNLPKFCNHFHLSLQSGSDSVLKAMNRKYTTKEYADIVYKLRKNLDNPAFTTDMIVGFPGETQKNHEDSCAFVESLGLSQIHVFKYSPRTGTPAAKFANQVESQIKTNRSADLIKRAEKLSWNFQKQFVGNEVEVLFESEVPGMPGFIEGLTEQYVRVVVPKKGIEKGDCTKVFIEEQLKSGLRGHVVF